MQRVMSGKNTWVPVESRGDGSRFVALHRRSGFENPCFPVDFAQETGVARVKAARRKGWVALTPLNAAASDPSRMRDHLCVTDRRATMTEKMWLRNW
jgi:hypothetical protein